MELKKAIIKLNIIAQNIVKCKRSAFFGVNANAPEIKSLWFDYNEVRNVLISNNEKLFGELVDLELPQPEEASSFGLVDLGSPVYYPKHFSTIENQVYKALRFVEMLDEPNKNKIPEKISANASQGANVSIQIGNNNTALQNVEAIDKTLDEIENLGIDKDDLKKLKQLLNHETKGDETKIGIGKRVMSWAGKMTSKLIEKELTDNIPMLIEKSEKLLGLI